MISPAYLLSLILLSSGVFAQTDTTQPPAGSESPSNTTTNAIPAAPNTGNPPTVNTAKKSPTKARPAPRFTPTEKIRADQAVAFPVDI